MIVFLIRGDRYSLSVLDCVLQDFFEDCSDNGGIKELDRREADKLLRRVNSGDKSYLYKSYLYKEIEHYFIAYWPKVENEGYG